MPRKGEVKRRDVLADPKVLDEFLLCLTYVGGDAEEVFQAHRDAGIDTDALALKLQKDGAEAFVKSWNELLETIKSESERLAA